MDLVKHVNWPYSFIEPFIHTSEATYKYNCIAHAVENNEKWFWPDKIRITLGICYWPPNVPIEETIDAFIKAYECFGYKRCSDGSFEQGITKIAIFAKEGKPTHAARQLPDRLWTSKLGESIDVSHTILAMENGIYGNVVQYLKKKS